MEPVEENLRIGGHRGRPLRADHDYDNYNRHNYTTHSSYEDLVGDRGSTAERGLEDRGFRNVDGFKSGSTSYTIWWNSRSRQCLQMATANGRADSITDIHRHPSCH